MTQTPIRVSLTKNKYPLTVLALALVCLLWAYWTTLGQMAQRWAQDPMYSHGYLVPGFALLLLWVRRQHLEDATLRPSWWGLPVLAGGLLLRLAGSYFYLASVDAVSLVPCLAGVWLMVGGRRAWTWAWPALAFLLFMIPLPFRLAVSMTGPLQKLATLGSTFLMQTLGMPALADGNVIRLNEREINIIEACSGLRMLVIFFALSTAVALVIRRPLWQKLVVVLSAVPIALVVNVLRITATGALQEWVNNEAAHVVFHDLAGWLMMPVALGFLALELKLLANLVIDSDAAAPRLVDRKRPLAQPVPGVGRTRSGPGSRRPKWQPVGPGSKSTRSS